MAGGAFERWGGAARQVVTSAEEEARTLRHDHVGTEHLLLGVLRQGDRAGARAVSALGLGLGEARAQVMHVVGLPEHPSPPELPMTPPARDALANALREAIDMGGTTVEPEHVLLALLRERDGVAVRVLMSASVDPRALREEVRRRAAEAPDPPALPQVAGPGAPDPGHAVGAHALLGVLAAGGPAADLLRAHGVDEAVVRALLR
jgi:ATP-dependent Clp protease ATP-binding subunit ClpC